MSGSGEKYGYIRRWGGYLGDKLDPSVYGTESAARQDGMARMRAGEPPAVLVRITEIETIELGGPNE